MKEEYYPDIDALCRLCLQESSLIEIFPSDASQNISIPMRIMACTALEVQVTDGLPKSICPECRYQLEKSYYFRKRSQWADSKLRKHIRLLNLGKKSRVFAKMDEDDFEDELEFEDSLQFLKEQEEQREKQKEEWKEELRKEMNEHLAAYKQNLHQECKTEVRNEVFQEVKEELHSEIEMELREQLRRECTELARLQVREEVIGEVRREEVQNVLSELEVFLRMKSDYGETIEDCKMKTNPDSSSFRTFTTQTPKNAIKRKASTSQAKNTHLNKFEVHLQHDSTDSINQQLEDSPKHAMPFEADSIPCVTNVPAEETETENEQNYYVLGDNDENNTNQRGEDADEEEEREVTFFDNDKTVEENYELTVTDSSNKDTTSYHLQDASEIAFYKNRNNNSQVEQAEKDERDDEANSEGNDGEVIVFNFEDDLDEEDVGTVEFMNLDQKVILLKSQSQTKTRNKVDGNDCSRSSSNRNKIKEEPTFLKVINSVSISTAAVSNSSSDPAFADSNSNTAPMMQRQTDTPKTFKCEFCPTLFSTENILNRHLRTHSKMERGGAVYQCADCNIYLSCKSALKRHSIIHSGQKPYVCDECGKGFVQREVLKRHMHTHTGERPFKCKYCERTFTQKVNLTQHINRNHMVVPMIQQHCCHLCPKRFNHASGLSRHLTTHNGVQFQCTKCERAFGDRSSIRRHILNVHGENRKENNSGEATEEDVEMTILDSTSTKKDETSADVI